MTVTCLAPVQYRGPGVWQYQQPTVDTMLTTTFVLWLNCWVGPRMMYVTLSILSSLLLVKCPSDLLHHCSCPSANYWGSPFRLIVFHVKRQTENNNLETNRKVKQIIIFCLSLNWNFPFVSHKCSLTFCLVPHLPSAVKAFRLSGICLCIKRQTKNPGSETNQKTEMISDFLFVSKPKFSFCLCQVKKGSLWTWKNSIYQGNDDVGMAKNVNETYRKS